VTGYGHFDLQESKLHKLNRSEIIALLLVQFGVKVRDKGSPYNRPLRPRG
jgi:hypothetical protein